MKPSSYCYDYARPAVSADIAVFGLEAGSLKILLIRRGNEPYKDMWALPGGFLEMDETIENCAKRELLEETSLNVFAVEQLHTYSALGRDPRTRVLTVAFWTIISKDQQQASAGDDAAQVDWFSLDNIPPLAFDHAEIITEAVAKLLTLKTCSRDELALNPIIQQGIDSSVLLEAVNKVRFLYTEE